MNRKKSVMDLTEGVIWKQLLLFALPLLGTSFVQQLYNTVDLLFAGNMIGKEATASVGASSLVITCIVGFFTGLSVGTGVIVSQAVGEGNRDKIDRTIHTVMGLSLAGGALLSVIGIVLARWALMCMNTPLEILPSVVSYVRIYLLSMVPLVTFNMNAGIIRATGDSRTPMLIQLVGGLSNVFMDWLLIRLMPNGIQGVAFATFFSQSVAAILSLCYMKKGNEYGRLDFRRVKIHMDILRRVLVLGIPAGLQNLVITFSNVFAQAVINHIGVDAIAGFASYFKVELLNYLPICAFGSAMMTFAGQNMGAGKVGRVKRGAAICIAMGIAYVWCSSGLLLLFGRYAFGIFNADGRVIASGLRIIRVSFPLYWLYVILEVLADAIRGAGKSVPPMAIILSTICVFRTICLFILNREVVTIERVAVTYPISWFAAVLCFLLYWKSERWIPDKF